MAAHLRHLAVAALVSALAVFSCRLPARYDAKPGRASRCVDGVCAEVVSFQSQHDVVGMWLQAPPRTRLLNAHLLADETAPCQGEMPLEWVTVDATTVRQGPLDVGGAHGLALGFPSNAWAGHSGYWRDMFVDLELDVGGNARCVRTRLTGADGKPAVGL